MGRELTGPQTWRALHAGCTVEASQAPAACRTVAANAWRSNATAVIYIYCANSAREVKSTAFILPQPGVPVPRLRARAVTRKLAPGHGWPQCPAKSRLRRASHVAVPGSSSADGTSFVPPLACLRDHLRVRRSAAPHRRWTTCLFGPGLPPSPASQYTSVA